MSKYIRGSKKTLNTPQLPKYPPKDLYRSPIHAVVRGPISPAAVGLASMMLMSTAAAQDAGTPPRQDSGGVTQQQSVTPQQPAATPAQPSTPTQTPPAASSQPPSTTALPEIQVRSARRPVRPAPQPTAPAPAAPPPPVEQNPYGDVGYQGNQQSITRLPTPLRDTPQTVNVVTQQLIQDQRSVSMEDALRYVPGITFSAGEGGQQGDGPIIRGFVARGDLFRDGIRDPGWYSRDLFNSDRVEVYKGPSAFAFGRGSTGGAINTVTKLPTGASFIEGTVTGTTGPGARAEVDASGKKDNFSGRIAAMYQDMDTPTRDYINVKRWGVAPSVSVQMNQTKATLSYIYQGEESVPDYGFTYLPQPAYSKTTGALTNPGYYGNGAPTPPVPAPRNVWYGIPNGPLRDITNVETHIATLKIEHDFDNGWKAVNATRYMINDRFSRPTAPRALGDANNVVFGNPPPPNYPPELMTVGRERRERQTDNTFAINQTDFLGKFTTGVFNHTFVGGVEVAHETRDQTRLDICNQTNIACRTSVFYPNYGGSPTGGAIVQHLPNFTKFNSAAAYMSDQAKIGDAVELLGSVRFDHFKTDYTDLDQALVSNRYLSRTDNMWSYRFGFVIHPTKNSSIYVVHGNSYNPSGELGTLASASAAALAPEQTKSYEIGAKVDVLKNQLSLTAAAFKIEKHNLRITDPANSTVTILDGTARVMGVELGATGKITEKWSVFTGYSYLDSRILETSDLSILNRVLPNTPRNNFTFWTTYDVTDKWTVGGGTIYQSLGYANQGNTAYVPEYWKFDAMVSYKFSPYSILQVNVYNLTDKLYYSQYFGNNVVPASGRSASLTWRVKFVPDKS
jgi:catecholate siderophore receptor